jgi:predicted phage gp36 major capsid-like protein
MANSLTFTETYLNRAANEIDASMFSGDAFYDETNRKALREWIARWERGLARADELAAEAALDEDADDDDEN